MLTVERLVAFKRIDPELPLSMTMKRLKDHKRVVYVDGAFDLLNPGHTAFLEKARALGDFLLVGIHTDNLITHYRGPLQPIAPMEDRALCLLACRWVDDVVLGVPWVIKYPPL